MSTPRSRKPWWEERPKSPGEGGFEAERERLRAELARAWRALAVAQQRPARSRGRTPLSYT